MSDDDFGLFAASQDPEDDQHDYGLNNRPKPQEDPADYDLLRFAHTRDDLLARLTNRYKQIFSKVPDRAIKNRSRLSVAHIDRTKLQTPITGRVRTVLRGRFDDWKTYLTSAENQALLDAEHARDLALRAEPGAPIVIKKPDGTYDIITDDPSDDTHEKMMDMVVMNAESRVDNLVTMLKQEAARRKVIQDLRLI